MDDMLIGEVVTGKEVIEEVGTYRRESDDLLVLTLPIGPEEEMTIAFPVGECPYFFNNQKMYKESYIYLGPHDDTHLAPTHLPRIGVSKER